MTEGGQSGFRFGIFKLFVIGGLLALLFAAATVVIVGLLPLSELMFALSTFFHSLFVSIMAVLSMTASGSRALKCLQINVGRILLFSFTLSLGFAVLFLTVQNSSWAVVGLWVLLGPTLLLPRHIIVDQVGNSERVSVTDMWRANWRKFVLSFASVVAFLIVIRFPEERCERECWGLFEGGMITIPWLGVFLFAASFSLAVLPSRLYARALIVKP